jgi:glucose dehydrogenase
MPKRSRFAAGFLTSTILSMIGPVSAAEVTADRLINADKEPQNWLMNHRTYDAQRYSPLDRINKANSKDLKLAYAVALGGTSANANLESTPLAEDGYLYVVDQWGPASSDYRCPPAPLEIELWRYRTKPDDLVRAIATASPCAQCRELCDQGFQRSGPQAPGRPPPLPDRLGTSRS